MTTANIAYSPHIHQARVHASQATKKVIVAGRQSGKTVSVVQEVSEWAMSAPQRWPDDPLPQFWWVTGSYKTKPKAWRDFNLYVPKDIVRQTHESEAWIELRNGSRITFRSADGKEALVSERLHGLVCDESGQYRGDIYDQLLAPMTATTSGPQILLGTPRGHNWFYDKYQNKNRGMAGWDSFHWRTEDSPYVDKVWLAERRLETPARLWQQEYLAEFLTDGGEVFRNVDSCIGPIGRPDDNVSIGFDLARTQDWSHLMAFNGRGEWVASRRVGHLDWSVQRVAAIEMYRRLKARKIVIDVTGIRLGEEAVAFDLRREGLNVETIQFNSENKRAAVELLMLKFDMNGIRIPEEAAEQFREYSVEQLPSGNERFSAPDGKHDDMVMATALGMWGIRHLTERPSDIPKTELDALLEREINDAGPNAWVGKEYD